MVDLQTAADYGERESRAVISVLIELGQLLGLHRRNFVVVGGVVPSLLFRDAKPRHAGTMDIDIDLNPEALSEGEYANLIAMLVERGYERDMEGLKPFQLRRWVDVRDGGNPIAILVDLLMPRNAEYKRNRPPLIENLRVQGIDGGEVALNHFVPISLEGEMPDGRRNNVELLVASVPALLVMKGHAISGRDKLKDAYDIWFCLCNYKEGIEALAEECRALLSNPVVAHGFGQIVRKFRDRNDYGPVCVRKFVENSLLCGDLTLEQVQTDAYVRVKKWYELIGVKH